MITADGGNRGGHVDSAQGHHRQGTCRRLSDNRERDRRIGVLVSKSRCRKAVTCGGTMSSPASRPCASRSSSMPSIPLYLLYTSGSTGKPKGIQHSSAGYLLGAKVTRSGYSTLNDSDVFWCTADVGWVTGHSYVAYGPLSNGATVVMYEGAPTIPGCRALLENLRNARRHRVLYRANCDPRADEAWRGISAQLRPEQAATAWQSVGEPINPEAWMWYQRVIGDGRCPIVDTWWQTETGCILISPVPGVTADQARLVHAVRCRASWRTSWMRGQPRARAPTHGGFW